MHPARVVMAYLVAPLITTCFIMVWGALGGSFHLQLREFQFLLTVSCLPHIVGTFLWMPFILSRDSGRFGRLLYLGAGAVSGFLVAALSVVLSSPSFQSYLALTISGALSALIFREIAVTGEETI